MELLEKRGLSVRIFSVILGMMLPLMACTGAGPRTAAIVSSPEATVVQSSSEEAFALIEVDRAVASTVSHALASQADSPFFKDTSAGAVVIGAGDTLEISIVSTSEDGFVDFTTTSITPVSSTPLPPQEVSSSGTVNVPPVGRILARGKTVQQFENFVTRRLSTVFVKPSVIVRLSNRQSARVTVTGQVGAPGAVSLSAADSRLIDMITAAGGPTARSADLQVTLIRRGRSATIGMDKLYNESRYNIFALPGDVILIEGANRKLTVLGAGASSATLYFDEPSVSLVDALGRFGGLQNQRADLKGVFLYRESPRATILNLGADVEHIPGPLIPTIYRFDFTQPTVLFTANAFEIADGDILFISDNRLTEINGVISAFAPFVPTPVQIATATLVP